MPFPNNSKIFKGNQLPIFPQISQTFLSHGNHCNSTCPITAIASPTAPCPVPLKHSVPAAAAPAAPWAAAWRALVVAAARLDCFDASKIVKVIQIPIWVFPKMVVSPKHPRIIILVGKPIVVGYHHFRKPPYIPISLKHPERKVMIS